MFDQLLSYLNARLTNYDVKRFLRKSTRHAPVRSLDLAQLEDRVMMSAAPLAAALDGGEAAAVQPALEQAVTDQVVADVPQSEPQDRRFQFEDGSTTAAGQREEHTKLELVFVDTGAGDYQQLVDDLLASADDRRELEVYLLDSTRDGIQQISQVLAGYDDVDAMHLVSHGSDGQVKLGNTWLNIDNLESYAGEIAGWDDALRDGGDLLIYGCNLAATGDGQALTEALGALCDCDVAASVDDTGAASRGGDWDLEFAAGSIETGVAFSSAIQQDWTGLLALETIRDEFNSVAYSNNDGTQPWTNDWQEIGDAGNSPTTGDVRIATKLGEQGLWLKKANNGASREADLSGATTATLSFDYGRIGLDSSDFVTLEISSNGGGTWAELDRFQGPANDPFLQFTSYDISAYIAGNTQIRFMTNSTMNNSDQFIADNIQIEHDGNAPGSAPPTLTMPSGPLNYSVSDPLTIIDATPTISDPDSADFDGGSLTVSFTAGGTANDRLIIDETGDFTLQGSNVRYTPGGPATTIGTWSGGTDGSTPLVINFNLDATPALAEELVANIGYQNVSATPNVSPRTVEFVVTDGDGATSNLESETINIVSTVPELDLDGDDSTASGFDYQTNYSFGAGPVSIVDLDATLFDFDSANLSQIEIVITNNTDKPDEILTADTTGTNITLNWNPNSGRLRLQGNEPIEDYLTVLKTVKYEKTVSSANTDPRIITFVARDTDANLSATATSTVYIQEATALWLTTEGNVLPGTGTPTLSSWNRTEVIEIADPNLRLETTAPAGTTNGTFSSIRDFGPDMTFPELVDAIHFVSRDILVGGGFNTIQLEYGDLLFTVDGNITMGGVDVDKGDVAVFRPSDPDNYSLGGTYSILIDNVLSSGKKISALTLVEQDTLVGDVTLQAGTFLYAYNATGFDKQDIFQYEPTAVGEGTTAGNVFKIIEGLDVDISKDVNGLELIENTTTLGGTTLQSGWIIVTQGSSDTGVGSGPGGLSHTEFDLFYLDVTTTTKGSGTSNATATLLFDGSDAGIQMTSSAENLSGISLYTSEGAPIDATNATNNPPNLTSNLFPSMDENLTVVQTLTANDLDGDSVSFAITGGNDSGLFSINGSDQLVFDVAPDFESPGDSDGDNIHEVEVTASDGNGGTDVELINVTINPVNDNDPVFTSSDSPSIFENLTIVQTLTATDADLPSQTITFSIAGSGADDALFSINGSNQLVFDTQPDFEAPADANSDNVYEVDVTADDGNGGTTLQSISVTVDPLNDNSPVFTSSSTSSVDENNSFVFTVVATDADSPSQTLSYSIVGGADAGFFSINNATGDLSFAAPPDFETPLDADTNNIYQVRVQADDSLGGTASQLVNVSVNPTNDNNPVFTSSSTPFIAENTTAVITVNATDADLPAQTVSYSIVGGADFGFFTINGASGDLAFVAPPDFDTPLDADTNNVYEVDVEANDGFGGSVVQAISVTVTDVNTGPTTSGIADVTVNEDAVNTVIDLTAYFSDAEDASGDLFYFISGNTNPGLFSSFIVDNGADTLTLDYAPDQFGTSDITITARDSGLLTVDSTFTVTVDPRADTPSITPTTTNEDTQSTAGLAISSNAVDGPEVTHFKITNITNGTLYQNDGSTLINDGDFILFAEGSAGLKFTPASEYSGPASFDVQASTTGDNTDLSAPATASITVDAVNDPPTITSSNTANVAENTTSVHTVTSTDLDGGLPAYSISGGNDGGLFTVNSTTGDLSFLVAPDFELPGDLDTDNIYEVEVTVDDGNGGSDVQAISVTVTDANDAPIATDDNYATNQDTTLTVGAGTGLLFNDSDPEVDPLSVYVVDGPTNGVLGIAPVGTINDTNLTNDVGSDQQPMFSPDGSKIAFKSDRNGGTEIFTMNADGTNVTQLTFDGAVAGSPVWSPDGTKLTFFSDKDGNNEIYSINDDGTGLARLTTNGAGDRQPNWSPDGTKIVFLSDRDGNNDIYVMDADGTNQTPLTTDVGTDNNPAWSPDGSQIVFTTNRDGNFEIYTMNADGTNQTRVTTDAGNDRAPRFSPDGSRIVFNSVRDGDNEIFVIDVDGSNETQLTFNIFNDAGPGWSPDGTQLVFESMRDSNSEIYVVDLLFDGTFDYVPNSGVSGVDTFTYVANDGSLDSNIATATITVNSANIAPTLTGGATAAVNVAENTTAVTTITATDADLPPQTLNYSISGGADQTKFNIDSGSGVLTFAATPDFESPTDANIDNVYEVTVQVSDGNGGSDVQAISVTVTDVVELLVVDTASDILDGDTSSIGALLASKGLDGFISLREAIEAANNTAGLDAILFNIAGAGLQTIAIDSTGEGVLPTITEAVIIDGYTQPLATANALAVGNDANLLIELDGSLLGGSGDGLVISGGGAGSTIRGLVINRFGGDGIEINGGGNNTIEGNFIGTNATGTSDFGDGLDGIRIDNSADNTIGGTTPAARNLISGNNIHGVRVLGSSSTNNRIQGSYIGTNAAGTAALGNTYNGVWIASGASNNTIGGTTAGAGNVISGNGDTGVEIQDNTTTGNLVQGNLIGTNAAGTGALGNLDGVIIEDAPNNTIGGATTAARNVISGNTGGSQGHGIVIFGDDATGNLVQNNYIGTDMTGNADLGNQRDGVVLGDSGDGGVFKGSAAGNTIRDNLISGNDDDGISISDGANSNQILGNLIGTNAAGTGAMGNGDDGIQIYAGANTNTIGLAGDGNVIAASGDRGISIKDAGTDGNVIQGNYIGTDLTGSLNLGNATSGVLILASAADNIVGGPGGGDGNVIAYSGTDGVELWGTAGTGNTIRLNSIFANTELGIDLVGGTEDGFGVTANDGGDGDGGPNSLQNYPVLSTATVSGTDITIDGTLNSTPGTIGIVIDFYWSAVADGSGHGEAEQYIGSTSVNTNASGNVSFSVPFIAASVPVGSQITATATDPSGSTSEFSLNVVAATVTNTPPTITATSFNVAENTTAVGTVTVSDPDLPPDTITWSITGSGADDTLFTINPGNGALVFNSAPDFESSGDANGDNVYEVEVQVSDGTDTDTQTAFVTVNPVNDNSPAFTTPAALSINENTTFVQTVNATDADLPAQTVTYTISGGNDALLFTINNATGDLSFLSAPDFEAPADFDSNNIYEVEVTADDNAGNTTPQLISVSVNPVNDNSPAFTTPAALSINENTTFVQTVNATDADLPAQTVTYTISGGNDALLFTINNATGDLSFLSAPDFEAPADFDSNNIYEVEVTADDNAGNTTPQLISVTINPVNDNVPNPAAETITLAEGSTTNVLDNSNLSVLDNDFDADLPGDTLTAVLDSGPSFASSFTFNGDGTFSYTHDGTSNYSDGFSYHVNDGVNNSATIVVPITITTVNNPPALGNNSLTISEGQAITLTPADLSATDADNPDLGLVFSVSNVLNGQFELVSAPGAPVFGFVQAQITAGSVQFVHDGGELAPSYDVTVSDGVASDSGSAAIVFNNVNDDPTITSPAATSIVENNSFVMTVTSSDVDGGAPSYTIIGGADGGLFAINPVTGDLSFITPPDFEVSADADSDDVYEVQVQVTDGFAGSDTQLIRVAVTDMNEDPLITSAAATVVPENTTAVLTVAALDPDSDTLTFSISGGADAAHFTIDSSSGELIFSSPPNFESPADTGLDNVYEVSVRADDGKGGMDEQLFLVTVADANDAPSSADDHYTVDNDDTLTAVVPGVLAGDFDEDGDPLTVTLVSGPTSGTLTLHADGSFSYTPSADYFGNDSFTYQVDDGNGGVDTATVQITINVVGGPTVDPPVVDPPPPTSDPPPEAGDPPPPTVDPPPLETRTTTPGPAPRERRTFVPSMATGGMLSSGLMVADLQDFGSTFAYQRSVTANRVLREAMTAETVEALERFMAPFDVGLLANDLQEMVEQLSQDTNFAQVMAGSAVGISGALTVGYVLWTIRGGWLLTSLLAQMPAWRMVDPLVVLSYLDEESEKSADPEDEEDDSLESLLDKQTDEVPPADQELEANSEAFAGQIS